MGIGNQISQFYKSFSGTDTLAFILMPGCTPVVLGSLTTISYSMFRNKKPVINIGRTNINGVTRGSRIYAGTMIFTLINQHWLKEVQEQIPYIKNFSELKVDELPLFDIMIISANEYGNAVSMYIFGIDFTDEAQTISVEDLFTENTFSFVARDISTFKSITNVSSAMGKSDNAMANPLNEFTQRCYILNSSNITLEELGKLNVDNYIEKAVDMQRPQEYVLARPLYLCTSKLMIGNDVATIQTLLNHIFPGTNINGVFDERTDKVVRQYQSMMELDINGIVDNKMYNHLLNHSGTDNDSMVRHKRLGIVVNRNGSFLYYEFNNGYALAYQYNDVIVSLPSETVTQKTYTITEGSVSIDVVVYVEETSLVIDDEEVENYFVNEDIENINNQIDNIKQQIDSINLSLEDYKSSLACSYTELDVEPNLTGYAKHLRYYNFEHTYKKYMDAYPSE